jgi:hypothetical protein
MNGLARLMAALLPVIVVGLLSSPDSVAAGYPPLDPTHPVVGTLESDPAHAAAVSAAGVRAVVVGLGWNRCEPKDGLFDAAYLKSVLDKLDAFRRGGMLIVLDLGVQYPPGWIFRDDSAHFRNQFGQDFDPAPASGDCGVNLVFSEKMREKFSAYVSHVFAALGTDFYAIRLGGGRYGELGYPTNRYQAQQNCYWAFDPGAQGRKIGLPPGQKPCPVPGWLPGQPSENHQSAAQFLDWYMDCLKNYHDWQISTVRSHFSGPLLMLYPSIGGLRPGQLAAAVKDDCNGSTGPEKSGEVQRGYDTARFVAGITDPQVVVYSTWIDGFPFCDDASMDVSRWSPGHYLGSLAASHRPPLFVGGENTGHPDDTANMQLTFRRMRDQNLCVLFWAFEPGLFDGINGHATLEDLHANLLVASKKSAVR